MGSEFIDRAKLEAEADHQYPQRAPGMVGARAYEMAREAFLGGAAAYAALLDAETTEEWGVLMGGRVSEKINYAPYTEESAKSSADGLQSYEAQAVSRRVTPWLPSEGGEKP